MHTLKFKPLLISGVTVALCLAGGARASTVVKDHVSDPAVWSEVGIRDHFLDPMMDWSAVGAAAIVGNGQVLQRVGIIWAHGSYEGEPNGGDPSEIQYRFRFYPDTASFSLESLFAPPSHPEWTMILNGPVNADWSVSMGQFLGTFDLFYSEVDVSYLRIRTTPGQIHLIVLVPESRLANPGILTAIAVSSGGGGSVGAESDWYASGAALGGVGPASLHDLGEADEYLAYRVTTYEPHPRDLDDDGDVDDEDLGNFRMCFSGPSIPPAGDETCMKCDFDRDGDIDQGDFGLLQRCYNGPDRAPPADCVN
jgi:hypothetical protein